MSKKLWVVPLLCGLILLGGLTSFRILSALQPMTTSDQVMSIDKKIGELEEMKRGYEAKAIHHESEGERLQFVQGEIQTARKHWKLAQANREVALKLQKDIDDLRQKKAELLKPSKP